MSPWSIIACAFITIAAFLAMEFVAWSSHKYVMHGFLWNWHRSHHTVHDHRFEKNDLFGLVFSIPSIAIAYYFSLVSFNPYMLAVALGIFCYGVFYLVFHDVIVHQRIKWRPARKSRYLQRMIHAHYIHHAKHSKDGCEAFGFLIAPKKYQPKAFVMKEDRSQTQ
jgi:beta-carotene 3-hydroxylase